MYPSFYAWLSDQIVAFSAGHPLAWAFLVLGVMAAAALALYSLGRLPAWLRPGPRHREG
jgi:hypothetical protein